MQTVYQTLKFVYTDFNSGWLRTVRSYGIIEYRSLTNGGKLKVVTSDFTGDLKTYFYNIPPKNTVVVIQDVIHIPARAYEQHMGNKITLEEL